MAEQSLHASSHLMSPKWVIIITIISEALKPETKAQVPQQMNEQSPRLSRGLSEATSHSSGLYTHNVSKPSTACLCSRGIHQLPMEMVAAMPQDECEDFLLSPSMPLGQLSCAGTVSVFRKKPRNSYCFLPWNVSRLLRSHRDLRHSWQFTRCCYYPHQTFWLSRVVVSLPRDHCHSRAIAPHTWGMRKVTADSSWESSSRNFFERLHHCLLLKSYYLSCISLKSSYFDPHLSIPSLDVQNAPRLISSFPVIYYYYFFASP